MNSFIPWEGELKAFNILKLINAPKRRHYRKLSHNKLMIYDKVHHKTLL